MANASANRIGQINSAGDDKALFLKLFAGEVITQFEQKAYTLDKHHVRTISNGKSASFPVVGKMPAAQYHTPGSEIVGQNVPGAEVIITVDALLLSHVFIADIDEAMNHYDVRSIYSNIMGEKLANAFDLNIMREIILGARMGSVVTGGDSGSSIVDAALVSATADTKANAWIDRIFEAAATFDNKNAPKERFLAVKPSTYYFLTRWVDANGFSLTNQDYGTQGSVADGNILKVAGFTIVPCNTLPSIDYSTEAYHAVNASTTQAIAWTPDAVGTVKLMDMSVQSDWDIRRQGTLMVARYAYGHKTLRQECCYEFKSA
jgi:hypothetical protein